MIDIELIRNSPELVEAGMKKRAMDTSIVAQSQKLDVDRRELMTKVETLKAERNTTSKDIGRMKDEKERKAKIEEMRKLGDKIDAIENDYKLIDEKLFKLLAVIPNIPFDQVPEGGEEDNQVIKEWGEKPEFDFTPKAHWDLGPELKIIDFEQGVRITGSRFYVLSGAGARLQRALIAFMLDLHIKQGYLEKYTPALVREKTVFAAGQLPKFQDNLYKDHEEDLYLIPTAEVPLTGLHMDSILEEKDLPLRYTAYSPSFRREKMSAGRDVRGIKRGHQFDKVEMYKFVRPENSMAEFESMVEDAEKTCQALGLPYRLLLKAAGDTSEAAHISYDIEIWAAGCNEWLEVSSISLVGDFQARRAAIRYRPEEGKGTRLVHTINGSGLGLPRTLIGVMENNQEKDGSIVIPKVLEPWMGGIKRIEALETNA